jgi:hypothetical protein
MDRLRLAEHKWHHVLDLGFLAEQGELQMNSHEFNEWFWEALGTELRIETIAGKYDQEFPNLRRVYLEVMCERERQRAYWDAMCGVRVVENKLTQEPEQSPLVFN